MSDFSSDEEGEFDSGEAWSGSEKENSEDSSEKEDNEKDDDTSTIIEIKDRLRELLHSKNVAIFLNITQDEDGVENYIEEAIKNIKNFDRVDFLNVNLISLAALFDILYKGKIDEKSVTSFVKIYNPDSPLDIIRYIRMYKAKKI
jgi:hypothetical protein